jgi:hypothetical protein
LASAADFQAAPQSKEKRKLQLAWELPSIHEAVHPKQRKYPTQRTLLRAIR